MATTALASNQEACEPLSYVVVEDRLMLSGDLISSQIEAQVPTINTGVSIVDLSGIRAFDSAGVAWLVTYFTHSQYKFINYPADLSQLADLYGLSALFPASDIAIEKRDC